MSWSAVWCTSLRRFPDSFEALTIPRVAFSVVRRARACVAVAVIASLAAAPSGNAAPRETYQRFYAAGAEVPGSLVSGPDGAVWFTWERGLGRLSPDGSVRLYSIAGTSPEALTVGTDGALWFVDPFNHRVGRFELDGTTTLVPVRDGADGRLGGIAPAPDGTFWLTNLSAGLIERLEPDGDVTVVARLPSASGEDDPDPWAVAALPDGGAWFGGGIGIGRVTASLEVRLLHRVGVYDPSALAVAPDQTVWAAAELADQLVHVGPGGLLDRIRASGVSAVTVAPDGVPWFGSYSRITRVNPENLRRRSFVDPLGTSSDCGPYAGQDVFPDGMTVARDGAVWAGDSNGGFLRVGPSTATSPLSVVLRRRRIQGKVQYLALGRGRTVWAASPHAVIELRHGRRARVHSIGRRVGAIARGPDGRPWFSVPGAIARLTRSGHVKRVVSLASGAVITTLTPDRNGEVWFVDSAHRRVGRIARGRTRYYSRGFGSARLVDLAVGPAHTVWLTDTAGAVHRLRPDGRVRRYGVGRRTYPLAITRGPDGAMWFTQFRARRVARITQRGRMDQFKVSARPAAIARDSTGAVWVTTVGGSGDNGVERITPDGDVRRFYVRKACLGTNHGFVSTTDGALLMTQANGPAAVVRLDLRQLRRTGQFAAPRRADVR